MTGPVPLYVYHCLSCGAFEVRRTMAALAPRETCPGCGSLAKRVYGAPAVTSPSSPLTRAREVADRSAHEPQVARGRPLRGGQRPRPTNPLHAKLPRP